MVCIRGEKGESEEVDLSSFADWHVESRQERELE
jgi:hypothetical protein